MPTDRDKISTRLLTEVKRKESTTHFKRSKNRYKNNRKGREMNTSEKKQEKKTGENNYGNRKKMDISGKKEDSKYRDIRKLYYIT